MPQILPFDSASPNYRMGTVLDGDTYLFDVRWNERDGAWYFDIFKSDETIIRSGIKIVLGTFLGDNCVDENWPDGVFVARDESRANRDAGYDDLGSRIKVYFLTDSDMSELAEII